MNYGHTEITESTERDNGHTDLTLTLQLNTKSLNNS